MKKRIAMLLLLLALLSLAACSENPLALQMYTSSTETPTTSHAPQPSEQSIIYPTVKSTTPPMIWESPAWQQELSNYLIEENGEYYLILPASGERIRIHYSQYAQADLERIDIALLMAAEAKLNYQMAPYNVEYHFYSAAYDGEIWLCVEAIVNIDPPNGEGSGCNIDHEHIILSEQITK